jgi:hypothetical protein
MTGKPAQFPEFVILLLIGLMNITRTSGRSCRLNASASLDCWILCRGHLMKQIARRAVVDAKGSRCLKLPQSISIYGTWSVADDQGQGAKQLHGSMHHLCNRRSQRWAFSGWIDLGEGGLQAATGSMTTGTVSHPELAGMVVMVKDSKIAIPKTSCGRWMGWAWFDADSPQKTTTLDYKNECISCHIRRNLRLIYVNGYPSLKR